MRNRAASLIYRLVRLLLPWIGALLMPSVVSAAGCDGVFAGKLTQNIERVFPLIPKELLDANGCNPAYWNLDVIVFFLWKGIVLLNWLGYVIAILLVVYAGLLYIGGTVNEGNVKKAKTVLMATVTGLLILVSARLLVYGAAIIFIDDADRAIKNPSILNVL